MHNHEEPTTIMMPVRALNEDCISCPELDISVESLYINGGNDIIHEICVNNIQCKHYLKCKRIKERLIVDAEVNAAREKLNEIKNGTLNDPLR